MILILPDAISPEICINIIYRMETKNYAYLLKDVMINDFTYAFDPEDLWKQAAKKKVIKYKMNDIKHWVYSPCWSHNDCFISIYQVLMQPKQFPEHIKRIKKANISYPLIVMEDEYNKFGSILDGNHRFAKLLLEKKRDVHIVFFSKKELAKLRIKM